MFALIDGNSFYCSCERAFDPTLRGKPLAVLSNNDGCAIARTNEAKDLGLKMGEPWHLASKRPELAPIIWMSSNYALYGDMSRRMYDVLAASVPRVDPYSIDEMFLDLAGLPGDHVEIGARLRDDVRRIAKIPTCVGIGPTKTIAKLANKVAKMDRSGPGVCDFSSEDVRTRAYRDLPLGEVWGMGRASVAKLEKQGVRTVDAFVAMEPDEVRALLTVVAVRTQAELRGIVCFPFTAFSEYEDASPKGNKQIRWFAPRDRGVMYFAGVYDLWHGDYGTKSAPNEGDHKLFSFLTTEANDLVRPVHAKAMPVVLQTEAECAEWLAAPPERIAEIQARVLPTDALEIVSDAEAAEFVGGYPDKEFGSLNACLEKCIADGDFDGLKTHPAGGTSDRQRLADLRALLVHVRNEIAHGSEMVVMPGQALDLIGYCASLINHLHRD